MRRWERDAVAFSLVRIVVSMTLLVTNRYGIVTIDPVGAFS